MSFESFFMKGIRLGDKNRSVYDFQKKKAFNRQYWKYGFTTGDSHTPRLLCTSVDFVSLYPQMGPSRYRETSSGLPLIERYGE